MIVIGITKMLSAFGSRTCNDNMEEYYRIFDERFEGLFHKYTTTSLIPSIETKRTDELYLIFKMFSLIEIREYLYLLVPLVSNSMISQLRTAIDFIEKDIHNMSNDDSRNNIDLITINKELKNENEKLKNELFAIKNIINGTNN